MEQGSNIIEEEATEEMTITEVTRMNDWLKAMGMSDKDILGNYYRSKLHCDRRRLADKRADRERIRLTSKGRACGNVGSSLFIFF